jgi:hypothetical protein
MVCFEMADTAISPTFFFTNVIDIAVVAFGLPLKLKIHA